MNSCVYHILKHLSRNVRINGLIVEIGSLVVDEKYWLRNLFENDYIGIDMRPGREVDLVCNSHNIKMKDGLAGMVICSSMLEHDTEPARTVKEIKRILRPGGKAFITVPFDWSIHSYPNDYWRFTTNGLLQLIDSIDGVVQAFPVGPDLKPHTIVGLCGMSFTVEEIDGFNKKYPHSSGRVYYYLNLILPQILFGFYKCIRYGRKV